MNGNGLARSPGVAGRWCALGACLGWLAVGQGATPAGPAADKLRVVAYINQASGCQTATENVLRDLAKTYAGRLEMEMVDFGSPAGRERWQGDGMHCMGIRIGGTTVAEIVEKGVRLTVRFEMPVDYQWTHEELVLAVRQRLDGVKPEDRQAPAVATVVEDGQTVLKIEGQPAVRLADAARLQKAADVLRQAVDPPVTLEDFGVAEDPAGLHIQLRGRDLLVVTAADAQAHDQPPQALVQEWGAAIVSHYPIRTRPFPGRASPRGR